MKHVKEFYDGSTYTLTYIVWDGNSKDAVIIDPVLDFEMASGKFSFDSADKYLSFIEEKSLKIHYIMETHAHADHLTSAIYLKEKLGAKIVIGEGIKEVQSVFKNLFNFKNLPSNGDGFDILVSDKEVLSAGELSIGCISTNGHTPACMSFHIDNNLFTGDSLFMPDYGVGRCDFPKGSASDLYHSVHEKIYSLPDDTNIFVGHDYLPNGRELKFQTSVGESKKNNIHISAETTKDEFVEFRNSRDKTLSAPRLLLPSIQVNAWGGKFPDNEENGVSYLKIPTAKR